MNLKANGQLRRSQVITTYGPGALIDLPKHSAIVGGLDTWPATSGLDQIIEPRLTRKLQIMTGVPTPALFAPPPDSDTLGKTKTGIGAWRFPEWFVVHEPNASGGRERSRRLVHRKALDERGRFDGRQVVATRFVRACPRGHVDDLDWRRFVHAADDPCPKTRQLWLDERGTTGDLANLYVRCECRKSRNLYEATLPDHPLGTCRGARPWLGRHAGEDCHLPSRLLIRTASNAWFPQVVSVLSIPDRETAVATAVAELWPELQYVDGPEHLAFAMRNPAVAERLAPFNPGDVLTAIQSRTGGGDQGERPVKQVELEALIAAPEGFGDDIPVDPDFHARRCPMTSGVGPPAPAAPNRSRRAVPASRPSSSFTGCARCWRCADSPAWSRSRPTSTASTKAMSNGRPSRWSRAGFRRWRTAVKGYSCSFARTH